MSPLGLRRVSRGLGIPQGPDGIYPGAVRGKRAQAYGREGLPRDPLRERDYHAINELALGGGGRDAI